MTLTPSVVWFFTEMGDPEALREAGDVAVDAINEVGSQKVVQISNSG